MNQELITPQTSIPLGYKKVVHRYYTEIVPIDVNIPQTPVKKNRPIEDSNVENVKNVENAGNKYKNKLISE